MANQAPIAGPSCGSFLAPTLQRYVPAKNSRASTNHLIFFSHEDLAWASIEIFMFDYEHC